MPIDSYEFWGGDGWIFEGRLLVNGGSIAVSRIHCIEVEHYHDDERDEFLARLRFFDCDDVLLGVRSLVQENVALYLVDWFAGNECWRYRSVDVREMFITQMN